MTCTSPRGALRRRFAGTPLVPSSTVCTATADSATPAFTPTPTVSRTFTTRPPPPYPSSPPPAHTLAAVATQRRNLPKNVRLSALSAQTDSIAIAIVRAWQHPRQRQWYVREPSPTSLLRQGRQQQQRCAERANGESSGGRPTAAPRPPIPPHTRRATRYRRRPWRRRRGGGGRVPCRPSAR